MIAPTTLTHLMTDAPAPRFFSLDEYRVESRPLIQAYKLVYQRLQLEIISDETDWKIGEAFQKVDEAFQRLINLLKSNTPS